MSSKLVRRPPRALLALHYHSVVVRLEGSEAAGIITRGSLRATAHLASVHHTMRLEDQARRPDDLEEQARIIPTSITTRAQLNEVEQLNITEADH